MFILWIGLEAQQVGARKVKEKHRKSSFFVG